MSGKLDFAVTRTDGVTLLLHAALVQMPIPVRAGVTAIHLLDPVSGQTVVVEVAADHDALYERLYPKPERA